MRFFKYTYKQLSLFTLLMAVFILTLFYRNNLSPTLQLRKECKVMEEQLIKAQNATVKLQVLKAEYRKINRMAGNSKRTNDEIHQRILTNSTLFAKKANISSVREVHVFTADKMQVVTHLLDLEGAFTELVQIAHQFEHKFNDARLTSLKIYSIQDNRTKKLHLYGTYYFQNFKK